MGFFDFGETKKKVRRKALRIGARARHIARKSPLGHYAPSYGFERTLAGTKLSPKAKRALRKGKVKSRRKTKKILKRVWRKII